jgi:acyl carrier protein
LEPHTPTQYPVIVKPGYTYLIVGGLGGIGRKLAQWLADRGATHIILASRRPSPAAAEDIIETSANCETRISIVTADVADPYDVERLLRTAASSPFQLKGIIHAAGVLDDSLLASQTWHRFYDVLRPKVLGAWNLHYATNGLPLDWVVYFSSLASLIGSPAQANYAAANAFLDGLAQHRRANGLPALSINWGPWSNVGMASREQFRIGMTTAASRLGSLSPNSGLQAFAASLASKSAQVAVMPLTYPLSALGRDFVSFPLTAVANHVWTSSSQVDSDLQEQLLLAPRDQAQSILIAYLQKQVQIILGEERRLPDTSQGFRDLGLDSLMLLQLRAILGTALRRPLPATLLFKYPTIRDVAYHLLDEILEEHSTASSQTFSVADGEVPVSLSHLSEKQLEQLLLAELRMAH